jgi:hypothetical protein
MTCPSDRQTARKQDMTCRRPTCTYILYVRVESFALQLPLRLLHRAILQLSREHVLYKYMYTVHPSPPRQYLAHMYEYSMDH